MVTFNLEEALGSGKQMLQPTGDLFIDPIKLFVTTLLSEGSKKLMQGLFSRAFPTTGVDQDLSALNGIQTAPDVTNTSTTSSDTGNTSSTSSGTGNGQTTTNLCTVPGPLNVGDVCIVDGKFNNGACKTCYCESKVGITNAAGITTYGTCQQKQ